MVTKREIIFSSELLWIRSEHLLKKKRYEVLKRIIDIVCATVGLLLLSPILLFVALRIKLEDPSCGVIFRQERIGKNEVPFTMYKFRSMCQDAESQLAAILNKNEIEGAMFKIQEDPRVTHFGRFIRKTSLDELPQLVNVLKGEMSLIGPRPPLPREVLEYTPYDKQRLLVKPGCSGLWQVSGRNKVSFKEMVALDLAYIHQRSIFYDFKLMVRTVKAMIVPSGSY
ncbi:sugar transferase [Enterococcus dispar]|uniref:sugar transferase n=1 Tax=Enterococcus dispar TaxID=44009 RepID=UPI0024938567|nr:sugar transferase [Enterococcus dispar]